MPVLLRTAEGSLNAIPDRISFQNVFPVRYENNSHHDFNGKIVTSFP